MSVEAVESEQDVETAPAKKQKTGGRVKKSLDQLMSEARIRNEIAGMNDDTTLPEELAAIYLGISVSELAEMRKPPKKVAKSAAPSKAPPLPRLKMIKPIREGAVGQNQKVLYKLGHLRAYQESITVESSFDAAVVGGIYGFMTIQAPFFAKPATRSDRGRATLVGKAWDKADPHWGERFKALFDGKLRAVWMTPAEAASSRWAKLADHRKFAKPWLAVLKGEASAVRAALEATGIATVAAEAPLKHARRASGL